MKILIQMIGQHPNPNEEFSTAWASPKAPIEILLLETIAGQTKGFQTWHFHILYKEKAGWIHVYEEVLSATLEKVVP